MGSGTDPILIFSNKFSRLNYFMVGSDKIKQFNQK